MTTKREIIKVLVDALEAAKEHLEFCGYGDQYERECAVQEELPSKISEAIQMGKEAL